MSELSRSEFEQKLAELAAGNPEAREQLLTDPKSAIEALLTIELPEGVSITVHEEDADTLHFVLPPAGDELSAAELAAVSGGSSLASGGAFRSGSQGANTAVNTAGREIDTATVIKRNTNTASTFYYLQAGAFARVADADRRRRQLVQSGMDAFVTNAVIEGKRLYRVRLGPFYDSNSLGSAQNKLGNRIRQHV